jgi:hypothetical protein
MDKGNIYEKSREEIEFARDMDIVQGLECYHVMRI